jgi:hypothetical protein
MIQKIKGFFIALLILLVVLGIGFVMLFLAWLFNGQ